MFEFPTARIKTKKEECKTNNRLQTIKECDLVDIVVQMYKGEPVNIEAVTDDIQWLIKQAEKVESLQKQLDAKIMFVNNGMEEAHWALQEEVIRLESNNKALKNLISADVKHQKRRKERS